MGPPPPPLLSPALRRLQASLRRGDPSALQRFWERVERIHTPIVERVPPPKGANVAWRAPTGELWLTFVYRGGRGVRAVDLECSFGVTYPEAFDRLAGTDVWYRTLRVGRAFQGVYRLVVNPGRWPMNYAGWVRRIRHSVPDPLNPRRFTDPQDPGDPKGPHGSVLSVVALAGAPEHPWLRAGPSPELDRPGLLSDRLRSPSLRSTRRIWVYLPPGRRGDPARRGTAPARRGADARNLVVFFDGFDYAFELGAPESLEALQKLGRIGPTAALFVDHGPNDRRAKDLLYNERFGDMLSRELLPWARRRFGLRVPPSRTVVAGASYGGLAAVYWAFRRPERFGAALSQSGSLMVSPDTEPEPAWLPKVLATSARRSIRFHLDAGLRETHANPRGTPFPTLLGVNRHLRDVLTAKGYEVDYAEFEGGHDDLCWRQALPGGLRALLREGRR